MTRPATARRARVRAAAIRTLVPTYLVAIGAAPLGVAWVSAERIPANWRGASLIVAIPGALLAYVIIAGLLSRLTLPAIVAGKFPRNLGHEIYGPRRLYALCWTAIYYCPPIYHAILAIPLLKTLTFRLFGYRGSLDFQTYPDTWIRDLPLLSLGKGAYLSNKATVSPNMCLRNGKIIIAPVTIGERVMIGHLAMVAPGVEIGADSEVGVGAAVGVNVRVGHHTLIDHRATLDHESVVGNRCVIGNSAYIGRKAVVGNGVRVPPCTVVPARCVLATQDDIDALTSTYAAAVLSSTLRE